MKKFLYLRINALIGIIACIVLLCYTLSAIEHVKTHVFLFVLFSLSMLGLPVLHNLLIIFIYRRYYPGKEIKNVFKTLNFIFSIFCIIILLIFITSVAIFPTQTFREEDKPLAYMTIAITALLCITTTIQIIGSFRLIKIVRENSQLQLEASFD